MTDVMNVTTTKVTENAQQKRPASTDSDTDSDAGKGKSSKKQKKPSKKKVKQKKKKKKAFLDDWSEGETKSIAATGYRSGSTWKIPEGPEGASSRSPAG